MLAHMKKRHIEVRVDSRKFVLTKEMAPAVILYLKALSVASHEWITARELRREFLDALPRHAVNLKAARDKAGLSQVSLAKKTGMDRSNLIAYEKGRKRIGKKVALKLADVLNIDPRLLTIRKNVSEQ